MCEFISVATYGKYIFRLRGVWFDAQANASNGLLDLLVPHVAVTTFMPSNGSYFVLAAGFASFLKEQVQHVELLAG